MTARPAVSVLMTAFNRESYIGPAVESVLAQTFEDFELIIVDDGSTDGTADVARSYLSDRRVRLVQNERNLGDYPNRNHAATFATGEYIKYHDSDDLMYPHCLSVLVGALAAAPSAAFAMSGHRSWPGGPSPMLLTPRLSFEREFMGEGLCNFGPAAALFRREAFAALGGFPERGSHSDSLFWLHACARVDLLLVYGDLYWYREHPGQEMHGSASAYEGASIQAAWMDALRAPECPLPPADCERAKRSLTARILRSVVRDLRRGDLPLACFRVRHAGLSAGEWLRYASRPQTSPDAGVPRMRNGDVLVPEVLRRSPALKEPLR